MFVRAGISIMKLESFKVSKSSGAIPEGDAEVTILSAEPGNSESENETPQVTIQYQDSEGKKLTDWRFITPNSVYRFNDLLEACGIEQLEKVSVKTIKAKSDELIGKHLGITTVEEADPEGVMRNRVQDYFAIAE